MSHLLKNVWGFPSKLGKLDYQNIADDRNLRLLCSPVKTRFSLPGGTGVAKFD
jgi:hypothetical protein